MPTGIYTRTKEMYIGRGEKISLKLLGVPKPPVTLEHRQNLSKALTGIKRSEETRAKMSACKIGVKRPSLTIEHKKKLSEAIKGEKSYLWKGGVTKENDRVRHSREYRMWRVSVFERDNYTCTECGNKSSKDNNVILNADHIKQFAYYPELRFDINNGRTLCVPCHKKTDTYKAKVSKK